MADVSNEPRDDHGRWTAGGSGGSVSAEPDARAFDVGGDQWNKQIATKLESQYAAARPALHAIAEEAINKNVKDEEYEEDEENHVPESWEELSGDDQQATEDNWKNSNYDHYYDNEVENWSESDAPSEAADKVADDEDWKAEWLADYIAQRQEEGEPRIPYTADQLMDAIEINFDRDNALGSPDVKKYLDIDFDESKLQEPDNVIKGQMTLPGIEPQDGAASLTQDMRDDIKDQLTEAFWDKAEEEQDKLQPPDYLSDSAKEMLDTDWGEMSDSEKFDWAHDNTDVLSNYESGEAPSSGPIKMPEKMDPMNTTDGPDYKNTQRLAKYMADHRAVQLLQQRGIASKLSGSLSNDDLLSNIQRVDAKLWSGWKGSSTGEEGRVLQVAAADELGGRLRGILTPPQQQEQGSKPYATFPAGHVQNVTLFSGATVNLNAAPIDVGTQKKLSDGTVIEKTEGPAGGGSTWVVKETPQRQLIGEDVDGFTKLPDLNVMRNGAASMTTDLSVANNWGGTPVKAAQISPEQAMAYANNNFSAIGGYAGVKAAVRAKWETTQYLLDRANMPTVQAYRGISMPHTIVGAKQTGQFQPPVSGKVTLKTGAEENLIGKPIGASYTIKSGKTITKVSNEDNSSLPKGLGQWNYEEPAETRSRVVLRADVPRTAVISVPAYGQNIHKEREVVVAGTGWKGWDAWSERAPSFDRVPMSKSTPSANAGAPTPENEAYKKAA